MWIICKKQGAGDFQTLKGDAFDMQMKFFRPDLEIKMLKLASVGWVASLTAIMIKFSAIGQPP